MKNRFFIALLTMLFSAISAHNDTAEQFTVALAETGTQLYLADQMHEKSLKTEKNYRRKLYWLVENNPSFYKMDRFQKNLDFYIAILANHIKVLEGKIMLKENGLYSAGMRSGAMISAISLICGAASYICFKQSKVLAAGIRREYTIGAVNFGALSALCAAAAGNQFYKVSRYQERLVKRLERDKKILAILQQEKAALDSKKSSAITEKVHNVLNAIVNTVTDMVKKPAVSVASSSEQ
jgi:hypothetical protein